VKDQKRRSTHRSECFYSTQEIKYIRARIRSVQEIKRTRAPRSVQGTRCNYVSIGVSIQRKRENIGARLDQRLYLFYSTQERKYIGAHFGQCPFNARGTKYIGAHFGQCPFNARENIYKSTPRSASLSFLFNAREKIYRSALRSVSIQRKRENIYIHMYVYRSAIRSVRLSFLSNAREKIYKSALRSA
jgi:hypothetical protein